MGYKPKWDEVISLKDDEWKKRVREIGALSSAHGWAKTNSAYQAILKYELGIDKDETNPF